MNFDLKQFYKFCSELKIETKEEGLKKMGNLLGTQTYVMNEIKTVSYTHLTLPTILRV